jgi:hypothetical protein
MLDLIIDNCLNMRMENPDNFRLPSPREFMTYYLGLALAMGALAFISWEITSHFKDESSPAKIVQVRPGTNGPQPELLQTAKLPG